MKENDTLFLWYTVGVIINQSIEKAIFLLFYLHLNLTAIVNAVFDAKHAVKPNVKDNHHWLLVLIAEKVRCNYSHILLVENTLNHLNLMSFNKLLSIWLLSLVGSALDFL
jgi:hypothetical protein